MFVTRWPSGELFLLPVLLYTADMIVTISGYPGSGKSTVGKLLAKKLGYRYFSIGGMRRAMARERGLTLQEFNVLGERHAFTDHQVDRWQEKLGRTHDNMVVEGRTSFHFIPHSVKIMFTVDLRQAARRIFRDRAHVRRFEASHRYETIDDLVHGLRQRMASDSRRYKKYYRLNIYERRHYDLVINTTDILPQATVKRITDYLAKAKAKKAVGEKVGKKSRVILRKTTARKKSRK